MSQELLLSSYLTGTDPTAAWQKGSQAKKESSGFLTAKAALLCRAECLQNRPSTGAA